MRRCIQHLSMSVALLYRSMYSCLALASRTLLVRAPKNCLTFYPWQETMRQDREYHMLLPGYKTETNRLPFAKIPARSTMLLVLVRPPECGCSAIGPCR